MAILLKEIGSFYIGGHQITISGKPVYKRQFVKGGPIREVDPNGDFLYSTYLHGFKLPENIIACPDLVRCVEDADCLIFCIPHQVPFSLPSLTFSSSPEF